jgi:hypothetical protein
MHFSAVLLSPSQAVSQTAQSAPDRDDAWWDT